MICNYCDRDDITVDNYCNDNDAMCYECYTNLQYGCDEEDEDDNEEEDCTT